MSTRLRIRETQTGALATFACLAGRAGAACAETGASPRVGGLKAVVSSSTLCSGGSTAARAAATSCASCSGSAGGAWGNPRMSCVKTYVPMQLHRRASVQTNTYSC